ncbi:MAG TPA: DUF4443 domain-containing protein [Desulfurococcaceae archaeon]|nr:DUF4443 domain-containing protein [Desulfurococcaceae archaeon]
MKNSAYEVLSVLEKIAEERRGIKPKFARADVYLTLYYIYSIGPLGRLKIASMLGLGEASIKTLIRRLKEQQLVETDIAAGVYLTNKGEEYIKALLSIIPPPKQLNLRELAKWDNAYALKLKKMAKKVEKIGIIDIRDNLIRYGADAALIIAVKEKPVLLGAEEYYHPELDKIANTLNTQLDDLILVSWSREPLKALKALIEEALDLVKEAIKW